MRGASRAAFGQARDTLTRIVTDDPGVAATVGDELFAVTDLLDHEPALRRALADPTSPRAARTGLVRDLFGGRLSAATLDQLSSMAAGRWSVPRDLPDATEQLAVMATAAGAEGAGELDDVEDELFRFGRIDAGEAELHAALASRLLPDDRKRELLNALLEGKVTPASLRLITTVRVAAPLTDSQRERLTAALAAIYGYGIQLNVVLDPQVVGGVSVRIGDELIDGTVSSRLAELRQRLAA